MGTRKEILIVDDDRMNRKLLETLLDHEGYSVRSVATGEAALKAIEEAVPDLMLLDLMMPGMDGFEVLRVMRTSPARRALPVIMITALNNDGVLARLADMGVHEVLHKPVDRWKLTTAITKLLGENAHD